MPITFEPLRQLIAEGKTSYYFLGNQGIDGQTLQRIRHDQSITTETLGKICAILHCQPEHLIQYNEEDS